MKLKTLLLALLLPIVIHSQIKLASGSIRHYENFKSEFVEARNIDVWVPAHYTDEEEYPVIYMHDGQMLFDASTTWNNQEWGVDETVGRLIDERKIEKCIIVGISSLSNLRHSDYFPQKPFESLSKKQQDSIYESTRDGKPLMGAKVNSDNYLKFIVRELKPFIDKNFFTKSNMSGTFIAGSSMGALISLYAICEYPEVFGGAVCISTHWPGVMPTPNNPVPKAFMAYLQANLPAAANHKLYFDHGTETLDASYKPYQEQVNAILKSKGYTSKNSMTKVFPGENHSEASWRKRFDIPLLFLLGTAMP